MGDGRLGEAQGLGWLADAGLAALVRGNHRDQPQAGRVGQRLDKPAVLAEMFRVLVPGSRIGITDVVAEDHLSAADRAAAGSYVGCIAGALSRIEYLNGLTAAGSADASVTFTTEAGPGMYSAIIRAVKPATT